VTAKENSRIPPLSEVRDRIAAAVVKEKREAAARAELETALAGAKTASDLERNATKAGLAVATTSYFTLLSGPVPGVLSEAGDIRRDLLLLSPEAAVSSKVYPAGTKFLAVALVGQQPADPKEKFLAVALVGQQPADPKEWEAGKDSFLRGLAEQKRATTIEAFLAERRKQAKVEINPEALK